MEAFPLPLDAIGLRAPPESDLGFDEDEERPVGE